MSDTRLLKAKSPYCSEPTTSPSKNKTLEELIRACKHTFAFSETELEHPTFSAPKKATHPINGSLT
jgi:hypothetical protein